jgi:hypothetical protein
VYEVVALFDFLVKVRVAAGLCWLIGLQVVLCDDSSCLFYAVLVEQLAAQDQ